MDNNSNVYEASKPKTETQLNQLFSLIEMILSKGTYNKKTLSYMVNNLNV